MFFSVQCNTVNIFGIFCFDSIFIHIIAIGDFLFWTANSWGRPISPYAKALEKRIISYSLKAGAFLAVLLFICKCAHLQASRVMKMLPYSFFHLLTSIIFYDNKYSFMSLFITLNERERAGMFSLSLSYLSLSLCHWLLKITFS